MENLLDKLVLVGTDAPYPLAPPAGPFPPRFAPGDQATFYRPSTPKS